MKSQAWIGLMGSGERCGRAPAEGQPVTDCTGKGAWSDKSSFDSSLVPDMRVSLDVAAPARYIPSMQGLDDKGPSAKFHAVCELACVKI